MFLGNTHKISMIASKENIVGDGLVAFLDASNSNSYSGTGSTWYDLSGNGRNFTWANSPNWTSDGSIKCFETLSNSATGPASNSFGINNTSGYTIIIGCKINTIVGNVAFKFYGSNNSGPNDYRGIYSHLPYFNDYRIYWDQGGCCSSSVRMSVYVGNVSGSWNIWGYKKDSSIRKIYKNGSTIASTTYPAANINLLSNPVLLASGWDTKLQVFLVYNRGLSDAEYLQNYNYLRLRYGI